MYKVIWEGSAEKDLKNFDKIIAKKIKNRVEKELVINPTKYGKPLVGDLKGLWSFRFSKYRVIYKLEKEKLLIIVVEAGLRGNIYRKR